MTEPTPTDIGALLRDQREKLGYSLQDAAQHTRIREALLESIENNRFSDLPGQVYVTGFVKTYASFLGVDSSALLKQLAAIQSYDESQPVRSVRVIKHQTQRYSRSSAKAVWSTFTLGLVAVLVFVGAAYLLSPMFKDVDQVQMAPKQVAPEREPVLATGAAGEEAQAEAGETGKSVAVPVTNSALIPGDAANMGVEPMILPPIAPGGSSLRMLALSEGSIIIYPDDRNSHRYMIHDGLDLSWKIQTRVTIELAAPGIARFWLDGQELNLGELETFQLQTATGE